MGGQSAAEFVRELRDLLPRDAVLVTDSGLHQIVARRHFEVRAPGGLLVPADLQAMGFGLPAAIAAKLAAPERTVVALVGDGGFAMGGLELATAVREGLDLMVVVCSDGHLGQIRLQQLGEYGSTHGTMLPEMDCAAVAEAVGAGYVRTDAGLGQVPPDAWRGGVWLVDVPVGDSRGTLGRRIRGGVRRAGRTLAPLLARSLMKALRRRVLP
jgi:acetolactate synthase-1/2/3 large subunit